MKRPSSNNSHVDRQQILKDFENTDLKIVEHEMSLSNILLVPVSRQVSGKTLVSYMSGKDFFQHTGVMSDW